MDWYLVIHGTKYLLILKIMSIMWCQSNKNLNNEMFTSVKNQFNYFQVEYHTSMEIMNKFK